MRRFRNISKNTHKKVEEVFPDLLEVYRDHQSDNYQRAAICIFDLWLTKEKSLTAFQSKRRERATANFIKHVSL
jgi:hypothetical protein